MKLISKLSRYLEDKDYQIILKENQINIINYDEIIDFSSVKISIRITKKQFVVEGKNLIISKMMEEEILITGTIYNVRIN